MFAAGEYRKAEVKREDGFSMRVSLRRIALAFALLIPLVSCAFHPEPNNNNDLREKIFNAYGGRARLSQVRSLAAEGHITEFAGGDQGAYRRAWRRDGKLFVDIQYPKTREASILNGTHALRSADGKLEDANGPGAFATIYQYNEASMPFALLDDSLELENRGRELFNGAEVRVLRYTDKAGSTVDLFVNDRTYRIVLFTGSFSVDGKPTTLSSEYGNFQFVEGILLPFKIVDYAGSAKISETVIDDYLVNARFNDALFDLRTHKQKQ